MHFESPWALLLLLLIPALWGWRHRRAPRGALRFSTTQVAARAGRSLRQRLAWLPGALRVAALACLTVALARPQRGLERIRDVNRGIAIEMVLDRSSSMGTEMEYRGERLSRLDIVKRVFRDFVMGDGDDLDGRPSDLIGIVAFARYPDTVCPLTLAHGALGPFLDATQVVRRESEDGTAIGDALALAAARLKTAEKTLAEQAGDTDDTYEIKSKIIILLTDGENNRGKRTPLQAAELAAKWGIKIYAVGVGGESFTTVRTPLGNYKLPGSSTFDERTLKEVAHKTGGLYRRARTAKALQDVYEEIDRLERSEIESVRFVDYKELFGGFALAALVLAALEMALACTVFRRIP